MSHTVKMDVQIRDLDAFADAMLALGATALGNGTHQLFETREIGLGFSLPGFHYPVVATASGDIRFDDYNGRWGDRSKITDAVERYTLGVARKAAEAQGWYVETAADGSHITIYHPDGGTITVERGGTVDAACFEGRSCAEATSPIELALGRVEEATAKPEMLIERIRINEHE